MKKNREHKRAVACTAILAAAGIAGILGFGIFSGIGGTDFGESSGFSRKVSAKGGEAGQKSDAGQGNRIAQYENGWEAAGRDTEYVYCVGSVSKIYSTAAVMRLVEEGRVELDRPVTDYIPEFHMEDPRYRDITVRMLMDHTSGLMGSTYAGGMLYEEADKERMDRLPEYLATQRLKADPGEYASYCNDGFDLLAIIAERVSGMDFTEYVQKMLAAPTGGTSTGSGATFLAMENLAPAYTPGHNRYEQAGTQVLGAGGIYATASDTAKFGAAFFEGNDSILSEASKAAMATPWSEEDFYMDDNGLGWDMVSMEGYENAGVSVLGKGGDSGMNHAFLLVAPGEQVSVSVLTNGGSSMLNGIMAEAILDAYLEESGRTVADPAWPAAKEIVPEIPGEYDGFAGAYAVMGVTGCTIDRITFPEHKYMHVESIGPYRSSCTDFVLTGDGRFAELAYEVEDSGIGEMRIAMNPMYISFHTMSDGQVYIAADINMHLPGMGEDPEHFYMGEKMREEPVSADAAAFMEAAAGREFLLVSEKASSSAYDTPFAELIQPADFPGYVFLVNNAMGTRLLRITDATHAEAFTTIPSSRNRDLTDIALTTGQDGLRLVTGLGVEFLSEDAAREFGGSTGTSAAGPDQATWFRIGNGMTNAQITLTDFPEHSKVYVYNKFGEVVYTPHLIGLTDNLPMPEDGWLVMLGE